MSNNQRRIQPLAKEFWSFGLNSEIDEFWIEFFISFLVTSPAYEASAKGVDLFIECGLIEPDQYFELWTELTADISTCHVCADADEFDSIILEQKALQFLGKESMNEAIAFFIGDYKSNKLYAAHFSSLPRIESKGKSNAERKKEADLRRNIASVDSLFRHLRNSLAHGRFKPCVQGNEVFILLEDKGNDGNVTSRMILSKNRIMAWMSLLSTLHNNMADGGPRK